MNVLRMHQEETLRTDCLCRTSQTTGHVFRIFFFKVERPISSLPRQSQFFGEYKSRNRVGSGPGRNCGT